MKNQGGVPPLAILNLVWQTSVTLDPPGKAQAANRRR